MTKNSKPDMTISDGLWQEHVESIRRRAYDCMRREYEKKATTSSIGFKLKFRSKHSQLGKHGRNG